MKKYLKFVLCTILVAFVCPLLLACNEKPQSYSVNVNVWYSNYGFASGSDTYEEGEECSIVATPKNNSSFMAWMKENVIVSYESEYNFTVNADTSGTYTAIFTCPDLELVSPTQLTITEDYETELNISNVKANVKLGSSYNTLKEVLNNDITEANTLDIENITMALNKNTTIYCEVNLTYSYDTIVEDENLTIDVSSQTYIEIKLNENELTTVDYELNLPQNIDGKAYISFSFANFEVPEQEQEQEQEQI